MKRLLLLTHLSCTLGTAGASAIITNGLPIIDADRAMKQEHFKSTGLEMAPRNQNEDMQFWHVDQGVIVYTYSRVSGRIVRISYFLCDERPKDVRKNFSLEVISFNPSTGVMALATKKGEPDGAANRSQPVRDESSKDQLHSKAMQLQSAQFIELSIFDFGTSNFRSVGVNNPARLVKVRSWIREHAWPPIDLHHVGAVAPRGYFTVFEGPESTSSGFRIYVFNATGGRGPVHVSNEDWQTLITLISDPR